MVIEVMYVAGQYCVAGYVLPLGTGVDMLATTDPNLDDADDAETPIYEKHDKLLHGPAKTKTHKIVSMQFMKKYVHVARALRPVLTTPAAEFLAEEYSKLRSHDSVTQDNIARTAPVTPRTLETMIRLSTAHAKCRLSKEVLIQDAEAAVELILYAYFKKVEKKQRKRRHSDGNEGESSQDEEDVEDEAGDRSTKKKQRPAKKPARKEGEEGYDPYDFQQDEDTADEEDTPRERPRRKPRSQTQESSMETDSQSTASSGKSAALDDKKLKAFRVNLFDLFKKEHAQSVTMEKVKGQMGEEFSRDELYAAIEQMMDANQVMLADDVIFLI